MTKLEKIFAGIIGTGMVVIALVFSIANRPVEQALGSVARSNEYQSTTTDATFPTFKVIKSGDGSLAQVTITTAGTGSLTFYDATTTDRTLRTNAATTTLAKFQITTTVGTYTFDSIFRYGLLVETTGSNIGSTTITYR
jgi:hypothetical protein